jgi:hypothetical protein
MKPITLALAAAVMALGGVGVYAYAQTRPNAPAVQSRTQRDPQRPRAPARLGHGSAAAPSAPSPIEY